jgi:hypothetical protein
MPVVVSDHLIHMYVLFWFPGVVAVQVALPFDEILEVAFLPLETVIDNSFYFVFFFTSDQVG